MRSIVRAAVEVGEVEQMPAVPKMLWKASKKLPDAPSDDEIRKMLDVAHGWMRR